MSHPRKLVAVSGSNAEDLCYVINTRLMMCKAVKGKAEDAFVTVAMGRKWARIRNADALIDVKVDSTDKPQLLEQVKNACARKRGPRK